MAADDRSTASTTTAEPLLDGPKVPLRVRRAPRELVEVFLIRERIQQQHELQGRVEVVQSEQIAELFASRVTYELPFGHELPMQLRRDEDFRRALAAFLATAVAPTDR